VSKELEISFGSFVSHPFISQKQRFLFKLNTNFVLLQAIPQYEHGTIAGHSSIRTWYYCRPFLDTNIVLLQAIPQYEHGTIAGHSSSKNNQVPAFNKMNVLTLRTCDV
jgi:hypothetical protein